METMQEHNQPAGSKVLPFISTNGTDASMRLIRKEEEGTTLRQKEKLSKLYYEVREGTIPVALLERARLVTKMRIRLRNSNTFDDQTVIGVMRGLTHNPKTPLKAHQIIVERCFTLKKWNRRIAMVLQGVIETNNYRGALVERIKSEAEKRKEQRLYF